MIFCGLADYRPIPRNTKVRPAYRASNVLLKIARNGKSPVPRSIRSTGLKLIWRCQSEWSCSQRLTSKENIPQRAAEKIDCPFSMSTGRKEQPTMTKPREKTREELTAEIEDGKKKIRQLENWEKVLRQKLITCQRILLLHR